MFTKLNISLALLALSSVCTSVGAVTTTCMDFESLPLGAQYYVGTTQTYNDIYGELSGFRDSAGTWITDGVATIGNSGNAHGSGKESNLNNIKIHFIFEYTQPIAATFNYADTGGNVNLGVNGTVTNASDLSNLNGLVINGVLVVVTRTNTPGGHYGTVALIGQSSDIAKFSVGGQEFWIDDICVSSAP